MIESQTRRAQFVRGFFLSLESQNIASAVLHGGEDGFERELSDVDFVVDHLSYSKLPTLIHEYCEQSGWQLCQILRHETTAAYFVCSAIDDPSCAVALDACSDYQRNGTLFLDADMLLEGRIALPWGGYGLNPTTELRYRFAKASAKRKNTNAATEEFLRYPDEIRQDCEAWLEKDWSISLKSWDKDAICSAFSQLQSQSNSRPSLTQSGAWRRILDRLLHPSGLIVITGRDHFELVSSQLKSIYGHLYFRRFKKSQPWSPLMLRDLVASTMIVIPELPFPWSHLIPTSCIHQMSAKNDHNAIAKQLHARCIMRQVNPSSK